MADYPCCLSYQSPLAHYEDNLRVPLSLMVITVLLAAPARAQDADSGRLARAHGTSSGASLEVTEAYPGLLQRAEIPPQTAVQAALGKVKNGHLVRTAIEDRGRRLVYVIRVDEQRGRPRELLVDAETGRVLSNRKLPRNQQ